MRGWGEPEQHESGGEPAKKLDPERARKQTTQTSPVLARDVAKAELDEGFLDRDVQEALEEPRRREDKGVATERVA